MKKYVNLARPDHIAICRADERGKPGEVVFKLSHEETLQFLTELLDKLNAGVAS